MNRSDEKIVIVEKNRAWIGHLHSAIGKLDQKEQWMVMREAGAGCASDILALCEGALNHPIDSVDDLVRGWNLLRESKELKGGWAKEGERITGVFEACGCPLVRSGFVALAPTHCLCSKGMIEAVFSRVSRQAIHVDMKRAIGHGDEVCEFCVSIDAGAGDGLS